MGVCVRVCRGVRGCGYAAGVGGGSGGAVSFTEF